MERDFIEVRFSLSPIAFTACNSSENSGQAFKPLCHEESSEPLQSFLPWALLYLSERLCLIALPISRASFSVSLLFLATVSSTSSFLAYSHIACLATSLHLIS